MIDDRLRAPQPRARSLPRAGPAHRDRGILHRRLVAAALTEIAGSSDVVDCGFVTYSNEAKQAMLGVPAATLERTARSAAQTAAAMAQGALKNSQADLAVAITGIAGPGGGTKTKARRPCPFRRREPRGRRLARSRRFGKIGRRRVAGAPLRRRSEKLREC